jgi:hypothetical protein
MSVAKVGSLRMLHSLAGHWGRVLGRVFAVGAVFLLVYPVRAETDLLIHMVALALTGSDNEAPKMIGDRANCVFAFKNDLYRLNNVYNDRINIRTFQPRAGSPGTWITITLQGDETVFEQTVEPLKDDGSKLMLELRKENPDIFQPHHYTYTEYELHLTTENQDAVKRAWQYVYHHGCTGKKSPS